MKTAPLLLAEYRTCYWLRAPRSNQLRCSFRATITPKRFVRDTREHTDRCIESFRLIWINRVRNSSAGRVNLGLLRSVRHYQRSSSVLEKKKKKEIKRTVICASTNSSAVPFTAAVSILDSLNLRRCSSWVTCKTWKPDTNRWLAEVFTATSNHSGIFRTILFNIW